MALLANVFVFALGLWLVLALANVLCVTGQGVFVYCGEERGSDPQPYGITTQSVSSFTIPGSTGTSLYGQYSLARFGLADQGKWMYTEFQNQADSVFNPACTVNLYGDPAWGADKQCYTDNYAAASAIAAYTDTLHLTTPWTVESLWGGFATQGQWWTPFDPNNNAVYVVRFGLNGQYVYQRVSGTFWCNSDYLGDPLPGVEKRCHVANHFDTVLTTEATNQNGNMISAYTAPNGQRYGTWVWCAQEGNVCTYSASGITMQTPTYVRFGSVSGAAKTGTIIRLVDTLGSIPCTTGNFVVDPAPGAAKSCWWFQPNIQSQVSMPVGEWKQVAGGGTYGVSWGNSETYSTSHTSTFANSLSESIKVGYKAKFLSGEGSVEVTVSSTQTWTTSDQWTQAVTTTTATSCGAPACTGQLYQWSLTAGPQLTTAGGMTVPATVDMCYFACVSDLWRPICSPNTCSKTCPQSPALNADECCVCEDGQTCDSSMCHNQ